MGNLLEINEANFDSEVKQSEIPVLLDFWAPWCGPCRAVAPVMEELSKEYSGKIKIGKVNVDDNQGLAVKFGVQSIPTVIMMKGGEEVGRQSAVASKSVYKEMIEHNQ